MKFQTNVCPLCNKVLKLKQVAKVNVWSCSTPSNHESTHYEVEYDVTTAIQHIYIDDLCIDSFVNSVKSRIYHRRNNKWVLTAEPYQIQADIEDNIRYQLALIRV